jgi:hypothetical protein
MTISVAMAKDPDHTPPRPRRSKLRLYGYLLMWKKWSKSHKVAVISCTYVYSKDPASYVADES